MHLAAATARARSAAPICLIAAPFFRSRCSYQQPPKAASSATRWKQWSNLMGHLCALARLGLGLGLGSGLGLGLGLGLG